MKNLIPVLNQGDNEFLVDSRNFAKLLKLEPRSLRDQIEQYEAQISRLGQMRLQTASGGHRPQGGGNQEKFYYLNFDQASFILSLTRPTADTIEYRVRLLEAFRNARAKLRPVDTLLLSIPTQWRKTFKDDFYVELLNIYGDSFDASKNKPSWVGVWTNRFVYEPIFDGLPRELKAKRAAYCGTTGKDEDYMRLHRFLEEHAKDALKERLIEITTLLRISGSKHEFAENFRSHYHGQTQIRFSDLLSNDFGGENGE